MFHETISQHDNDLDQTVLLDTFPLQSVYSGFDVRNTEVCLRGCRLVSGFKQLVDSKASCLGAKLIDEYEVKEPLPVI